MSIEAIKQAIRDVPDFPKPGILFKDITPVLQNPATFKATLDVFERHLGEQDLSALAAIDARGFLFAGALCDRMGLGLVPIRKQGKLPWKTHEASYDLEYGSNTLAIHQDAFAAGTRVAIIDDLLATGGTAAASAALVEEAGGTVVSLCFLVELAFLNGREKLPGRSVFAPIVY